MLIKSFLNDRHQFIPVKRSPKTRRADLNGKYLLYLEKTIVISLSLILIVLHLFPRHKTRSEKREDVSLSIEVIDVPIVKEETPPPELPPAVMEEITPFTPIVKEEKPDPRKIREELETVTLDLNLDDDARLLAGSQLDEISLAGFGSSYKRNVNKVSLDITTDRMSISGAPGNGLDLNLSTRSNNRKFVDEAVELNGPLAVSREEPIEAPKQEPKVNSDFIDLDENQFLLKESESTIGTNEYRLWNKINGVMDRLDKNRFGTLPENVIRTNSGLNVSFSYRDGAQHDIFWSKGGKVIIRVTGQRPSQLSAELEKAFDALFRLTL